MVINNSEIVAQQKAWFLKGNTLGIAARQYAVKRLLDEIRAHEQELLDAISREMGKSRIEAFAAELYFLYEEGKYFQKHLASFARGKKKKLPFWQFPAKGGILPEPYGVSLVIAPWNYPLQLALVPALAALATGNTVIIRPSQQLPEVAEILEKIVSYALPPEWARVVNGEQGYDLYQEAVDYVFFTGSSRVGRLIGGHCGEKLIPCTLELGGKSPAIVTAQANLPLAAKRIVFGKIFNAGQTCVAPDYVLVDKKVASSFIQKVKEAFERQSPSLAEQGYPKIIGEKRRQALKRQLTQVEARLLYGGKWQDEHLQPTLIYPASWEDELMQEEIFAPILPVLVYDDLKEVVSLLKEKPVPLASYFFTDSRSEAFYLLKHLGSGGACVNDVMLHVASSVLPFGGKKESGKGLYHGEYSLEAFSHARGVFWQGNGFDSRLRYRPYPRVLEALLRLR